MYQLLRKELEKSVIDSIADTTWYNGVICFLFFVIMFAFAYLLYEFKVYTTVQDCYVLGLA